MTMSLETLMKPATVTSTPIESSRRVVRHRYGGPETIGFEGLADAPLEGEVVIRVHLAAIERGDAHLLTGTPYLIRLMGFGLLRPKQPVPGLALVGTVERVAPGVTAFTPGQRVFGQGSGACATFATAKAEELAPVPDGLGDEQAVALVHGGLTARQALVDVAGVRAGERVLVLGASGAVGRYTIQVANTLDCEVTAVVRGGREDVVRALGADHAIPAGPGDLDACAGSFDVVVDALRDRPDREVRGLLSGAGRVVMASGGKGRILGGMGRTLLSMLRSAGRRRKFLPLMAMPRRSDLEALAEDVLAGRIDPLVDQVFPLERTADAFRRIEESGRRGSVLVDPRL